MSINMSGTDEEGLQRLSIESLEINPGVTVDSTDAGDVDAVSFPIDSRDNEVVRIYAIDWAEATYGSGQLVNNARMAISHRDAIETFTHSNVYTNDYEDLLAWCEYNIDTSASGINVIQQNTMSSGLEGGLGDRWIDYPLTDLHWTASNDGSSSIHFWTSAVILYDVVEVSDDYNLDLLRGMVSDLY